MRLFDFEAFNLISDLNRLSRSLNNVLVFSETVDSDFSEMARSIVDQDDITYWCVIHDSDVNESGKSWDYVKSHYTHCPSPIDDFNNKRYTYENSDGEKRVLFAFPVDFRLMYMGVTPSIYIRSFDIDFDLKDYDVERYFGNGATDEVCIDVSVDGWVVNEMILEDS